MRLGSIGYLAKTGIGIMFDEFSRHLGAECQLVIHHDTAEGLMPTNDRSLIFSEGWTPSCDELYEFSRNVDVVFTVESDWGGNTFRILKAHGVKIVQIPMWEWYAPTLLSNDCVDLWICTTKQCYEGLPHDNKVFIPCPVDTQVLKFKLRSGPARTFVHNAGNLGIGGRKGTIETIRAFYKVSAPDIALIINSQVELTDEMMMYTDVDPRIKVSIGNVENYADLYTEGDVLIYCSHYDGQALCSAEAMAAGMPVITNEEAPMNEHWQYPGFLNMGKDLHVGSTKRVPARTINPDSMKKVIDEGRMSDVIAWCADHEMSDYSRENRNISEKAFSWDVCEYYYRHYLEGVCSGTL